jgi:hypothetical protein
VTNPLPDRWQTRDFPVLVEAARAIDAGDRVDVTEISAALELEETEAKRALGALKQAGYLEDRPVGVVGEVGVVGAWGSWTGLTERGRRAVGIWPSGQAADSLVDALRQAEDMVTDPEEKTLLRRAAGAMGSVSREVLTDVMAAVIKSQAGI